MTSHEGMAGALFTPWPNLRSADRHRLSGEDDETTINIYYIRDSDSRPKQKADSSPHQPDSLEINIGLNQCMHAAMAFPIDLVLGLLAGTLTLIFFLVYK